MTAITVWLALGCSTPRTANTREAQAPEPQSAPTSSSESVPTKRGELVTYQRGIELGREQYVDDGDRLESTLHFDGRTTRVVIRRSTHTVEIDQGTGVVGFALDASTVALETGSWAAFRVAAEQFIHAQSPTRMRMLLPSERLIVDAVIKVARVEGGSRELTLTSNGLETKVRFDEGGTVKRAEVHEQGIEVRSFDEAPPPREIRNPPAGVVESLIEISRGGVLLRGAVWRPERVVGRAPVVLFLAGSGPTDRDGNNHSGLKTDMYRMLATELAQRGVATCRFDKRGVGASGRGFDASAMVIDDLVGDAAAWVDWLRADASFGPLTLLGHSEGGEVALLLGQNQSIDGLILIAAPGRTHREILREQLSLRVDAKLIDTYDDIVQRISTGERVSAIPSELVSVLRPAVQTFVRSDLDLDPLPLARAITKPMSIVQGDADVQIRLRDARLLKSVSRDGQSDPERDG